MGSFLFAVMGSATDFSFTTNGGVDDETLVFGGQVEQGNFASQLIFTEAESSSRASDSVYFPSVPSELTSECWDMNVWPALSSDQTEDERFTIMSFCSNEEQALCDKQLTLETHQFTMPFPVETPTLCLREGEDDPTDTDTINGEPNEKTPQSRRKVAFSVRNRAR